VRTLVVIVAILAVAKLWAQDHLYRNATNAALLSAYSERATADCTRAGRVAGQRSWRLAERNPLRIGNDDADVAIWDWQNPMWDARYRNPNLVLETPSADVLCRYDVVLKIATVASP
jgi:hypothetical protein